MKTPRKPAPLQTLQEYLDDYGVEHFKATELLYMRRAKIAVPTPPRRLWPNIIPTLKLADILRAQLGHGLVVGNGYRPEPFNSRVGGAPRSKHVTFRALDLDLPKAHRTRDEQEEFYRLAVELWLRHGERDKIGLGLYRRRRGTRIHLDTGVSRRTWKRGYLAQIAEELR